MIKRLFCISLILYWYPANSQIVTTIAGNGSGGDGTIAINASIYDPSSIAFDKHGNLFFTTNLGNQVREVDTTGIIHTIAGTGIAGFNGDNISATAAQLNQPGGIAIDSNDNIYIADAANNRVREIVRATGFIKTIAGNGTGAYTGDGDMASVACLNLPQGICFDSHSNLYIADVANHRVRMINRFGIITTVAGNGTLGWNGDNGPATSANCTPVDVRVDIHDNLYIADWGRANGSGGTKVRKVSLSGIISTVAGDTVSYIYNGDNILATVANMNVQFIALDQYGALYISDYTNNRIRKVGIDNIIYTIVGDGIGGDTGDSGLATSAEIYYPSGMAFDSCGNLYFSQVQVPRIRKVTYPKCHYLSIASEIPSNELSIYPNPAINNLSIDNIRSNTHYVLLSMTGVTEQQGILKKGGNTISMQSLSPGLHLLMLIDEEGNKTARKIVKE